MLLFPPDRVVWWRIFLVRVKVSNRRWGGEVCPRSRGADPTREKHAAGELHRPGGLQPGAGHHHPGGVLQVGQPRQTSLSTFCGCICCTYSLYSSLFYTCGRATSSAYFDCLYESAFMRWSSWSSQVSLMMEVDADHIQNTRLKAPILRFIFRVYPYLCRAVRNFARDHGNVPLNKEFYVALEDLPTRHK